MLHEVLFSAIIFFFHILALAPSSFYSISSSVKSRILVTHCRGAAIGAIVTIVTVGISEAPTHHAAAVHMPYIFS
jgi:hypothetical protein